MTTAVVPGLYGKLPILGDFVSRRLPASFVQRWDAWIQQALSASREQLDARWLDTYLTSPIWRFVLSPGICGEKAVTGVLMPSVDRVGRYFPLTLAAMLDEPRIPSQLFVTAADWFDTLEQLALSALEDDINFDGFDRKLQDQCLLPPCSTAGECAAISRPCEENSRAAIRIIMQRLGQLPTAFIEMGTCLLARFIPTYSLWCTNGSELVNPSLLVYNGLPQPSAFADLLTGHWHQNDADLTVAPSLFWSSAGPETDGVEPSSEAGAVEPMTWRSCGRSTVGAVRKINEDAFLENPNGGVWAVADGMGGHSAGDEASKAVVEALQVIPGADTLETLMADVTAALKKTNADLIQRAQGKGDGQIMGSTVVVLLAVGEQCAAVWAGDSRLYRCRRGLLSQLTRDHSPDDEMMRQDPAAPEMSSGKGPSNIVTRALGAVPQLITDVFTFEAKPGDVYLLCSDGLTKEVTPQEMGGLLGQSGPDDSSQALLDLALARGARDNVTVVVVTADRKDPKPEDTK
jgi:type VI secretion system protein ImpM